MFYRDNHGKSNHNPIARSRLPSHPKYFEALENRVLMDAVLVNWTGGAENGLWSNPGNWALPNSPTEVVPNNTTDTVYIVKIPANRGTVIVDQEVTVSGLQVTGAGIDLNNHALTVTNAPDPHQTPGTKDPNAALLGVANFHRF